MNNEKLLESFVWVTLKEEQDFLKIKETLTRVGIASYKEPKTLYQSCHILHKQGKYAIVHFKEMFALDGKTTNFTDEDRSRRNMIASLLQEWKLCTINEPSKVEPRTQVTSIKIIPFKEKDSWVLESKYTIGKTKT